jgi:hypothetical protein
MCRRPGARINVTRRHLLSRPSQNPSSTGPSQGARPPKPPKSRQAPNKSIASPATSGSNMTSDASASASANNQPVAEPRRARPVIASRQFEAALNIAGLATSASERRKREKDRVKDDIPSSTVDDNNATSSKREGQGTTSDTLSPQASGTSIGLDTEKDKPSAQSPPRSPIRDRSRRGGRPGGIGRAGTQSTDVANPTPIKIPSILQRSDTAASLAAVVVPRQTSSNANSESPTKSNFHSPHPSLMGEPAAPRGRGRRGRGIGGRGLGRGGGRGGQAAPAPRESG